LVNPVPDFLTGQYLAYCVKVSDLVKAFGDEVYELDRRKQGIKRIAEQEEDKESRKKILPMLS
jgi:hypothetical protein